MAKEVEIKLKLTEIGSKEVEKIIAEITNVDEATKALIESIKTSTTNFEKFVKTGFQLSQVRDLISSTADILNSMTKPALDFDYAMRQVNTIAGKSEVEFEKLSDSISELATRMPIAREELAKGLYQVISSDIPEEMWLTSLEQSTRTAIGAVANLEQVILGTSVVIKNYGMSWEDAGLIQDKMQKAAIVGATTLEEMANSMQSVAGSSATLGVSLDELIAVYGTLTGASGGTSEVTTQLSGILNSLISPTNEATQMAKQMGIQFDATAIKIAGGLLPFLENLTEATQEYAAKTGVSLETISGGLFSNARSLKAIIPITGELSKKYRQNIEDVKNAAGEIDFAFGQMNKTAQATEQRLKNTVAGFFDFAKGAATTVMPIFNFVAVTGIAITQLVALGVAMARVQWIALIGWVKKAAIAIRVFAVSAAGSWVLATAGIAILITGIALLFSSSKKANEEVDKLKEEEAQFTNSVASSFSEMRAKYELLKQQYNEVGKSVKEKNKFIIEHREEIDKLGISINNAKDAENIFNKNTDAVVAGFKARALAAAYARKATEQYDKVIELEAEREKALTDMKKTKTVNKLYAKTDGSGSTMLKTDIPLTEQEVQTQIKIINSIYDQKKKAIEAGGEELVKEIIKYEQEAKDALALASNNTNKPINQTIFSFESLNKKLQELQKTRNATSLHDIKKIAAIDNEIIKTQQLIAEKTKEIELERRRQNGWEEPLQVKNLQPLNNRVDDFSFAKLAPSTPTVLSYQIQFENLEKAKSELQQLYDILKSGTALTKEQAKAINNDIEKLKMYVDANSSVMSSQERTNAQMAATSQMFRSIGDAAGGAAGDILTWAANTMQAVAQAITAIGALIAAKKAEATANTEAAATGAAASVAGIPGVGPILAVAAVASVIAALMNLPKFAEGGIAYGPTLGLFGEYSGAANNPEVVAPLSKLRDLIEPAGSGFGEVKFEIEGRTLIGVLNKVNRFNKRTT
ncbi:MAG: phage tail tape measure protein [Prevotellaceae bacterium]|jgi:TP901 family phage tail tape measure protein|nr:phage tail tape measure protein [Prevotellaceae bacterium]